MRGCGASSMGWCFEHWEHFYQCHSCLVFGESTKCATNPSGSRMCSLVIACVLVLWNVFSPQRIPKYNTNVSTQRSQAKERLCAIECSLIIECVLLLENVFSEQACEGKERLYGALRVAFPIFVSRNVDPWRQHMLLGWAFARWLVRSLKFKHNQSTLGGIMSSIRKAEFGLSPQNHTTQDQILGSWGLKRRSDASAPSPLRPPAGEHQAPPLVQRKPKHFLAISPSPPDTDSGMNSVQ